MSRPPAIDVVLFDLGGVLIRLGGMGDMAMLADEPDEDEIWRRWLTCPWVRRFERGECDERDFARGMVDTWAMPATPEAFLDAFISWPKGLLPGARELVQDLQGRTRLACLSNTNRVHCERYEEQFGLITLFDEQYLSYEMGLVKPDRAAFDHTLEGLGCDAERVLFLDDNQINVDGARQAGLLAEKAVGPDAARSVLERYGLF
ncbi:MAG: HAD family phosphatase [Myxococcota bacterium]